jgi:hypothetical protein
MLAELDRSSSSFKALLTNLTRYLLARYLF